MKTLRATGLGLMMLLLIAGTVTMYGQGTRVEPVWWFGGSLGLNFNMYSSDVHQLNASTATTYAFTTGSGAGLFLAPLVEYHPDPVWGGMLSLGYDGRGGSFADVRGTTLSTSVNYLSLEPSLRVAPLTTPFYFFGGPRIGFAVAKSFTYEAPGRSVNGDWSDIRGAVLGAQLGAGYDFTLTSAGNEWQSKLSPFIAFHFGQGPRSSESWSLATLRFGVSLKFGNTRTSRSRVEQEVGFSVKAPRIIPNTRTVKETFSIRNFVFFDEGSVRIPLRYKQLTASDAAAFREEQLVQPNPSDLTGRSQRQMTVYHNILNVIGDRLRRNSGSSITLTGASEQGPGEGETMARSVRDYLVNTFGIESSRIRVQGVSKPAIPSVLPGATRELELVKPEDRRVDITSSSPQILEPLQIISLQEEPLDSDVLLTVDQASATFTSWSVAATDQNGTTKRFGPYTGDQERIPGRQLLGDARSGSYTIALEGETRDGQMIRKEQTVRLMRSDEPEEAPGFRFSILFEFDQSKTVATYERFLTSTVAPLITNGSSVVIHGHTDIVGEESHNLKLSQERARETMNVLETALRAAGKQHVSFDTYGFGEDPRRAPFNNTLPEERFYNRCVVIDIVPGR